MCEVLGEGLLRISLWVLCRRSTWKTRGLEARTEPVLCPHIRVPIVKDDLGDLVGR